MRKKIIAIIALLIALMFVLSACGPQAQKRKAGSEPSEVNEALEEEMQTLEKEMEEDVEMMEEDMNE